MLGLLVTQTACLGGLSEADECWETLVCDALDLLGVSAAEFTLLVHKRIAELEAAEEQLARLAEASL